MNHRLPPYNLFFFQRKQQLTLVSFLCKPKTEVTGHSEVELVEMITPVCSRLLTLPRHPVDFATSTVDRKFNQVHFDLFLHPDSIFAVCILIRNFDMPGNEISRPIQVIFNGDNFTQWSQAMCSYLKGCKLWLYVFGDHPIPKQVDKETNSPYAIRIEDWESANHQIITWFCNTSITSIVDEFGNINIAKEV